jgi:hypothetical protein
MDSGAGDGNRFADGEVNRRAALDRKRAQSGRRADTGFIHNSRGSHLAGRLAVEKVLGVHAIQQERVAGVALAIGPDRLIAQAGVRSGAGGSSSFTPGESSAKPVKDPVGKGTSSISALSIT